MPDDRTSLLSSICTSLAQNDIPSARRKLTDSWRFTPKEVTKRTVTQAQALDVYFRDKFTCRYCGTKVVFPGTLRLMSILIPEDFPYHPNWKTDKTHPAYWELVASCDHLVPVARGGGSGMDNLVTACYRCNSSKANWTVEELGWGARPFLKRT
jgi:5-methylcytosine-specific restriction endonuclease McrA